MSSYRRAFDDEYVEFNILDVALKCGVPNYPGLGTPFKQQGKEWVAICPIPGCEDRSGHLYLNPETNQYMCFRCGNGGYAIGLYAKCHGISTKEAYRQLCEQTGANRDPVVKPPLRPVEKPIAPVEYRHKVYTALLKLLPLKQEHYVDLLKRGLSERVIRKNLYRSMPEDRKKARLICKRLAKHFDLENVPGFYKDKAGQWNMLNRPGLVVPSRNLDGLIQGLRIRRPKALDGVPKTDPRYQGKVIWFSASNKSVGADNWVHLAVPSDLKWKEWVAVTEGELKADVAAEFLGMRVLAVPGVLSWKEISTLLQDLGVFRVLFAYDADQYTNPHVAKAAQDLKEDLYKNAIDVVDLRWPTVIKDGKPWPKGIDDACVELSRQFRQVTETRFPNGVTVTKTVTQVETIRFTGARNSGDLEWWLKKRCV